MKKIYVHNDNFISHFLHLDRTMRRAEEPGMEKMLMNPVDFVHKML